MPCRDDYGQVDHSVHVKKVDTQRKKVDKLTKMLCALCKLIEMHHPDSETQRKAAEIPGLHTWWQKHKEKDATEKARKERDKKAKAFKKKALGKLTAEDKKALGL